MLPTRNSDTAEIRVAGGRAMRREARNHMAMMSQRQYAAHRGVARSAVQRAINEGRISTAPDGQIDADLADAEWERNTIAPEGDGGKLLRARTIYMVSKARLADMQLKKLLRRVAPRSGSEDRRLQRVQAHPGCLHEHSHAVLRRDCGRDPPRD